MLRIYSSIVQLSTRTSFLGGDLSGSSASDDAATSHSGHLLASVTDVAAAIESSYACTSTIQTLLKSWCKSELAPRTCIDLVRSVQEVQIERLQLWSLLVTTSDSSLMGQVVSGGAVTAVLAGLEPHALDARPLPQPWQQNRDTEPQTFSPVAVPPLSAQHMAQSEALAFLRLLASTTGNARDFASVIPACAQTLHAHVYHLLVGCHDLERMVQDSASDGAVALSQLVSAFLRLRVDSSDQAASFVSSTLSGEPVPGNLRVYGFPCARFGDGAVAVILDDDFAVAGLNESYFFRTRIWLRRALHLDSERSNRQSLVDEGSSEVNEEDTRPQPARATVVLEMPESHPQYAGNATGRPVISRVPSGQPESSGDAELRDLNKSGRGDSVTGMDIVSLVDEAGDDIVAAQSAFEKYATAGGEATFSNVRAALSELGIVPPESISKLHGLCHVRPDYCFNFAEFLRIFLRHRSVKSRPAAQISTSMPRNHATTLAVRAASVRRSPSPSRVRDRISQKLKMHRTESNTFEGGVGSVAMGLFPKFSMQYAEAVAQAIATEGPLASDDTHNHQKSAHNSSPTHTQAPQPDSHRQSLNPRHMPVSKIISPRSKITADYRSDGNDAVLTAPLCAGSQVVAQYFRSKEWHRGIVVAVRSSGSQFDIAFANGRVQRRVPRRLMRPIHPQADDPSSVGRLLGSKSDVAGISLGAHVAGKF